MQVIPISIDLLRKWKSQRRTLECKCKSDFRFDYNFTLELKYRHCQIKILRQTHLDSKA